MSDDADGAWLTIELTPRQTLDGVLLILFFFAIQIHSIWCVRRVYRVQRFSERNQRVYVVFSIRKVLRLIKEITLDYVIFFACLVLWTQGILAQGVAEGDMARLQDATVGDGELQMPMKVVFA